MHPSDIQPFKIRTHQSEINKDVNDQKGIMKREEQSEQLSQFDDSLAKNTVMRFANSEKQSAVHSEEQSSSIHVERIGSDSDSFFKGS